MARRKLVMVGNGMAGARAIENVLARGGADLFDITVFGSEPYGNYNRILLSGVLNGTHGPDDILINSTSWYADNGIVLHAGDPVTQIDRAAQIVTSARGRTAAYDVLLIATGSRAFIPPFKGAFDPAGRLKPGVFAYRTLDDAHAIVEWAKQSRTAVTIGGGLLGLEAARALLGLGCRSHVVHLAQHLLDMQLDSIGGNLLKTTMQTMGLEVHTGKATTEVLGDDHVTGLAFKDGTTIDCDLVVVAAGVRPNAEIGRSAGLTVERAIVVNDHMQSVDDARVYVVGECAQHRGRIYGLVAPLWDQAKVFADHVTGLNIDAAYHGSKLATKLKVMGVELASMGITEPAEPQDEVVQFSEPKRGLYKKIIVRNGRLVGSILMGEISKAAYLMQAFDRESPLPEERLALLFDLNTPSVAVSVADMPGEMQVCNCNGVSKAAICAAVSAGQNDVRGVMTATRAGMGCGSCKGQIGDIVNWFLSQAPAEPEPAEADNVFVLRPVRADGHCTPAQLMRIAEVANEYDVPVKFLGADRIEFVGLPSEAVLRLRGELFASAAE